MRKRTGTSRSATFLLALLLAAAAVSAAERPSPAVPRIDHHQHLLSPAGVELLAPSLLPAVEPPREISRLLRGVEEHWNDKAGLADLFVEDSVVLSVDSPGWLRGRAAVTGYLSGLFSRPYRMTPVTFRMEGTGGHVAGYLTRGEGTAAKPFGYFYLGLDKGKDGAWRIAAENPTFPGPRSGEPEDAAKLVELLDDAGIDRAVVLSDAYFFDSPKYDKGGDTYARVRAENDWTAEQVARFPGRLVAFCSFNPLRDYALQELERCAASRKFKGLKLHMGMSRVDLKNPEQVEKVRQVVEAANRLKMPLLVHVRPGPVYGREEAEIFLSRIVAAAPDVPFQIAHLWGGEGFSDAALGVYADAVSAGDPRTRNLYFDLAEAALVARGSDETLKTIARRIRQIGLSRILFASDGPVPESLTPREAWKDFRKSVPLTEDEIRAVASNVAPYLK
jgi:predicted TIM-barrel fold metal-dependent hydrolase